MTISLGIRTMDPKLDNQRDARQGGYRDLIKAMRQRGSERTMKPSLEATRLEALCLNENWKWLSLDGKYSGKPSDHSCSFPLIPITLIGSAAQCWSA